MAGKDHYAVLGVERSATAEEVKRAYRGLAMRYHPDRTHGDKAAEERFKEASEAYAVLSDVERRAEYDRFGRVRDAVSGVDPGDGRTISDIFGDIFGDLFGGKQKGRAARGRDLRYSLTLEFGEAVRGCERTVRIPRKVACRTCAGSGARPGSSPALCETCRGSGQIRVQQGFFPVSRTCAHCGGRGRVVRDPCRTCAGTGRVGSDEPLTVRVPAGVEDGQRLRVAGKGEAGEGGAEPGNLIVSVVVRPHPIFRRDGADLVCEIPVTMSLAALGGKVDVPTLDGTVRMSVPPGTASGKAFRLRGKGIRPGGKQPAGAVRATLMVETPAVVGDEAAEHLRRFERALPADAYPHRQEYERKLAASRRPRRRRSP